MLKSTSSIQGLVLAVTSAVMLIVAQTAWAAPIVWDGAVNNDWDTTTANWTGSTYTDGDDVTFSAAAGGTINLTADRAPLTTTVSAASGTYTFSGSNITSGNITKTGAGTLVFNSAYTGSGTVLINDGTIKLGASDRFSDTAIVKSDAVNTGVLDMDGFSETLRWATTTRYNVINLGDLTIVNSGTADRSGSTSISGSGSLTFGPSHVGTILSGNHVYTGGTFVKTGTLYLYGSNGHQLPATGPLTVDGGATFSLNYHNSGGITKTIGSLSGGGTVKTSNNDAAGTTFRVGNGGDSATFSGLYTGNGNLIKLGSGTQTLDGNNTYTGTTTIEDGTLIVNGTTGPDQDDYTVESGGTLGGTGTINLAATKDVIVESGGTIAPGTSPGTLTINGDLTLLDGSFLNFEIGTISDLLVVNGELTGATSVGGVTIDVTNLGGAVGSIPFLDWTGGSETGVELSDFQLLNPDAGELSISGSQLLFTPTVPEPSSVLSLAILFCLGARRRRLRSA